MKWRVGGWNRYKKVSLDPCRFYENVGMHGFSSINKVNIIIMIIVISIEVVSHAIKYDHIK